MSKFVTEYAISNGITTRFEAETAEDVLVQISKLGKGMVGVSRGVIATVESEPVKAEETAPPKLTLVKSTATAKVEAALEKGEPETGTTAPEVSTPLPAVPRRGRSRRVDQVKGAGAVLDAPDAPETVVSLPQGTGYDAAAKELQQPVKLVGNVPLTELATALRNLARVKGIPAATSLVNGFKTEAGESAQRLDQVQAADYPAVLAKIDALLGGK